MAVPKFDWTPEETAQIALGLVDHYRVTCWTEELDPSDARHVNTIMFDAPGDDAAMRYVASSVHAFRFSVSQVDPEATEFTLEVMRVTDDNKIISTVAETFYMTRQRA